MKTDHYLGMRPGDLDGKRYAPFWNPMMRPLQPQVAQAVQHGGEAGALGFPMSDADQLLNPGYLPLENGFTKLPGGKIFVAVRTNMPGVTGAMFEWWMGWHYMEHQRYKLWHPRAHIANGTSAMQGDNPQLSDREKYMTTHLVTEYVGDRREDLTITFSDPATVFSRPEPDDGMSWWAGTSTGEKLPVRVLSFHEKSDILQELLRDDRLVWLGEITGDKHVSPSGAEGLIKPLDIQTGLSDLPWHKDCGQGSHSYMCNAMTVRTQGQRAPHPYYSELSSTMKNGGCRVTVSVIDGAVAIWSLRPSQL
ncbi:hypothetical protein OAL29_01995 [Candidatus Binatia bacterium]|nr:hypothetical protein [Candidatus Binatia bacterium]